MWVLRRLEVWFLSELSNQYWSIYAADIFPNYHKLLTEISDTINKMSHKDLLILRIIKRKLNHFPAMFIDINKSQYIGMSVWLIQSTDSSSSDDNIHLTRRSITALQTFFTYIQQKYVVCKKLIHTKNSFIGYLQMLKSISVYLSYCPCIDFDNLLMS